MISNVTKLKLITLAAKHGIEIEHFSPGEVVVRIATWQEYQGQLLQLIEDLNEDPTIQSISFDSNGLVHIMYHHDALEDNSRIDSWLKLLAKYSF